MDEKKGIVQHRGKLTPPVILSLMIGIVVCGIIVIKTSPPDFDYSTPMPTRQFTAPKLVRPQVVNSSWSFETVFSSKTFEISRQGWLAVDSKGHPAMAYGGSQLNYAWFDGSIWHILKIDGRLGAGKYARLLFDVNDQPHIVYSIQGSMGLGYIHRDAQGWHQEVIDPDSCDIGIPNIAFDQQGNLIVVYVYNTSCTVYDINTQEIHIAEQTPQGWQVEKIGQNGASPSIAVDRSGQIHIAYELARDNHQIELVRQERGKWVTNELVKKTVF